MAANAIVEGVGTKDLIEVLEEEQKATVFKALGEDFYQNAFCDVILMVGSQTINAHKVVLASSSKFFRDVFKHYPRKKVINVRLQASEFQC